jgi:hypothetical protein
MRFYCIACEVLARPLYLAAAASPHIVDVYLMPIRLHEHPEDLNEVLPAKIAEAEKGKYDALLLGYGLCGNWLKLLKAHSIPVVIPKAHDCITLFLGDAKLYQEQVDQVPGTYWFTDDYIERMGTLSLLAPIGSPEKKIFDLTYSECVTKYGKENADYLLSLTDSWQQSYERAVWIDMGLSGSEVHENQARIEAQKYGWRFERILGDMVLIKDLLDGRWLDGTNPNYFIIPPGQTISLSYDNEFYKPCS